MRGALVALALAVARGYHLPSVVRPAVVERHAAPLMQAGPCLIKVCAHRCRTFF